MVLINLFNNVVHWAGVSSPFHPYHPSGSSAVILGLHQHQWRQTQTKKHFQVEKSNTSEK